MIHLVYSNQSSEIKKVVKAIAKQSLPERDDMNFVRYDGNNTLIQEIIDDANYVPLGYDKKVVAVDNCYFLMKPRPRNKIESDQDYKTLISYIKNWDEVLTIIEQAFGRKDFTITQVYLSYEKEGLFYNFGNGDVYVKADDVIFSLTTKDFIVQSVWYTDGQEYYTINTPSYNATSQ